MMVQQQPAFGGGGVAGGGGASIIGQPSQVNLNSNNTSIAVPAIVTATNAQSQQPQSQYSPQQFYQQQLVKNQQQQQQQQQQHFINQQQQTPTPRQMNGIHHQQQTPTTNQLQQQHYSATSNNQVAQAQQDSPNSNQMLVTESLYNATGVQQQANLVRPAPIYAPKPTYYGQSSSQQQPSSIYQPQVPSRPIPLQQSNYFQQQQQQQQHSPASISQRALNSSIQQSPLGLSVHQMTAVNGLVQTQPNNLSPMQNQHINEHRQQQQMQHLIMSYQQQQQQQQHSNASLQANDIIQQQQQSVYMQNTNLQPLHQEKLTQQHVDVRWSHLEEQQRQLQQQQQQQLLVSQALSEQVGLGHVNAGLQRALSDRDSVSTVSRFNQFDERRSFTMRSQYTNARNDTLGINKRHFSFLKLSCEALKRIMGLTGHTDSSNRLLLDKNNQPNMHRNLSLVNGHLGNKSSGKSQQPFTSSSNTINQTSAKVTVLDSAEDYYFKRKVFKYQLVILRVVNLLSTLFVLLSPIAMLIIPKMESVFNLSHSQDFSAQETSSHSDATTSGSTRSPNSTPSITHAVGLSGARNQIGQNLGLNGHHSYFMPQPQWKISECNTDCDGLLIGFVTRFIMLCIAYWAIFFRSQTASLPRIDFYRCLLTSMAILLTLAYWLFFIFRVFDKRFNDFELQYMTIVQFSLSMLESLILLHYLAVVLLELRRRKKIYCLKVVRSPDGSSRYYSCGSLSIQKCAQFVLEKYHRDFKQYGAYAEQLLELEDRYAKNLDTSRQRNQDNTTNATGTGATRSPRASRPTSPVSSIGGRSSRRTSRHHHRSPSRSPVRISRSRSNRRGEALEPKTNSRNNQVKLYQVDSNPPEQTQNGANNTNSNKNNKSEEKAQENKSFINGDHQQELQDETKRQQLENDSNSADQSSDATSKMKESSLETIKAANSTSDLLGQTELKTSAMKASSAGTTVNPKNRSSMSRQQQQSISTAARDETESVRSVRSRRSTMRSHKSRADHRERERDRDHHHHHHHHHHHNNRERSSSRGAEHHYNNWQDHQPTSSMMPNRFNSVEDPLEEHERKLRRRKYRLLVAVQDTFDKIKRFDEESQQQQHTLPSTQQQPDNATTGAHNKQSFSPSQAARSLYPNMARSLQKYLRLTKQTGRHNLQSIYEHLSKCLLYRLSARTFLEKFINQDPAVWQQNETNLFAQCRLENSPAMRLNQELELNSWSLVCDTLLSRQIKSGTFFLLKQGQVSLLVTVAKLPHLNLTEEVINQKTSKFTIGGQDLEQASPVV